MKHYENTEAELLREVQQKAAAFEDANSRCRERGTGALQQCLEPDARTYRDALNAFSELIFNGRYETEQSLRDVS